MAENENSKISGPRGEGVDPQPALALELFATLKTAVGKYIECDERPRPTELWAAMCEAQQAAAVWFNTVDAGR